MRKPSNRLTITFTRDQWFGWLHRWSVALHRLDGRLCYGVFISWLCVGLSTVTISELHYKCNHTSNPFIYLTAGWLGGVVVSVSDSWSRGRGFDSRLLHYQVMTLGKLFTPMCLCHQAVQFGIGQRAVMLCSREDNRIGLASHWPCSTDFSGLSTYGLTAT